MRYSFSAALFALVVFGGAGCNRNASNGNEPGGGAAAAARTAVGWTIDSPGEVIRAGRLLSTPAGQEDELLPAVATAMQAWSKVCPAPDVKAEPNASFRLVLSGAGVVSSIEPAGSGAFAKCMAGAGRGKPIPRKIAGQDVVLEIALTLGGSAGGSDRDR